MDRKMRTTWVSLFFFLILAINAHATIITESIPATITQIRAFDRVVLSVAYSIHLFDVTYDDQGTVMHNTYDDGSPQYTYDFIHPYTFMDDGVYTFSESLNELHRVYGGHDVTNTNFNKVFGASGAFGSSDVEQWYEFTDDDIFFKIINRTAPTLYQSGELHIYGATPGNRIFFGEPISIVVRAPVPEPATMILFGLGLLGLAGVSRRKK